VKEFFGFSKQQCILRPYQQGQNLIRLLQPFVPFLLNSLLFWKYAYCFRYSIIFLFFIQVQFLLNGVAKILGLSIKDIFHKIIYNKGSLHSKGRAKGVERKRSNYFRIQVIILLARRYFFLFKKSIKFLYWKAATCQSIL